MLDHETCYRAVSSRDPRFDGWFVTAVTTTGIYCRPSCPAMTPRRHNVRFLPTAAAAQRAGFRACLRCRPYRTHHADPWVQYCFSSCERTRQPLCRFSMQASCQNGTHRRGR